MPISYRIQHVAGRDEPLERLLGQLPSATVVTDFGGPPPNPWRGYQLCLEDPPDHHLCILQDDVVLSSDFERKAEAAAAERPENVISLFVGTLRGRTLTDYRQAMIRKERWSKVFFQGIHHCVALIWPPDLAREFLDWSRSTKIPGLPPENFSDDAVFGSWAKLTKREVWATVPCLVEHDDIFESTIGKKLGDIGRRAIAFDD